MYVSLLRRVWKHLPASVCQSSSGILYGRYVHGLVLRHSERRQSFGTFFLRNRAEMKLMGRLLEDRAKGSSLDLCVLACSKGAELYSILWGIRSARPDLKVRVHAVDISPEILEFAKQGVYSRPVPNSFGAPQQDVATQRTDVNWNTWRDQNAPIFERMTEEELEAMCEVEGDQVRVREWLKEGITWVVGDAGTPEIVDTIGPQDIVVANRFLCHMNPETAAGCLRNIAQLVKPGGYLFVSGVDLDVRARVAQEMGWEPITDMIREVHEGDLSLRKGWPLEYWGLEPFSDNRADGAIRYASVFRLGLPVDLAPDTSGSSVESIKQTSGVLLGK